MREHRHVRLWIGGRLVWQCQASETGSVAGSMAFDRDLVDHAFLAPFVNPKATDFVSKRLGSCQQHPVFGMLLDQVWVR